jgi:hypothetical protein
MAATLLAHTVTTGGYSNGTAPPPSDATHTVAVINSTGASFMFLVYVGNSTEGELDSFTDSLGNTWNAVPGYPTSGDDHHMDTASAQMHWIANPLTGPTHTITFGGAGAACLEVQAWANVSAPSFTGQSFNGGGVTPQSLGPYAANAGLALTVCMLGWGDVPSGTGGAATEAGGHGWTIVDTQPYFQVLGGSYCGCTVAYQLLSAPASLTSSWSWPGGAHGGVVIVQFAYTAPPPPPAPETVAIRRLRRVALPFAQQQQIFLGRLELLMQMGMGTTASVDPQVMIRLSKDGGFTWGAQRTLSVGKMGEYLRRCYSVNFGQGRQWVLEVSMTDPVASFWLDAFVDVTPGTA